MPSAVRPAVVWMPNVESLLLMANLTEEGTRWQSRAVTPLRRAAWLSFDGARRTRGVHETGRLLAGGFWLDALVELALAAEPFPRSGFAYPLSREAIQKAAAGPEDGLSRLSRYLEEAAAFYRDERVADFLRTHGEAYRAAVADLEAASGDLAWVGSAEQWFGTLHRSYLLVASLLMPAGFSFGLSVQTTDGPLAFHVAGPFIEPDGRATFAASAQAPFSAERELIRAFVKPVVGAGSLMARPFVEAFERSGEGVKRLKYASALECLEDHLVQVIQARLIARRGDRDAAAALLAFDEESGFAYTRPLAEALEEYELHRSDYPTFAEFFPHLMGLFAGL